MLIIVYVGAIAILFLFVIMMLDILELKKIESISNVIPIILCVFVNILTQLILYFKEYNIILNLNDLSV
jgi:NADH:ubiquinone oxidoreductase subunit 6 (subunit J)